METQLIEKYGRKFEKYSRFKIEGILNSFILYKKSEFSLIDLMIMVEEILILRKIKSETTYKFVNIIKENGISTPKSFSNEEVA